MRMVLILSFSHSWQGSTYFRNTGILKNCRPRACVFVKKQTTKKKPKKPLAPHQGKLMWPQNKKWRCQPSLPVALQSMWWGVELVGNFPIQLFFPTEKNVDSLQLGLSRKQAAGLPSPPAHTACPKLVGLLPPLPSRSSWGLELQPGGPGPQVSKVSGRKIKSVFLP